MPIYAYRCEACGHAKDVLQRLSDPVLSQCPACSADTFRKQVTAAGFQLKGSGWYVTDFRDGSKAKADGAADKPADDKGAGEGAATTKPADAPAPATAKEATSSSAPAAVPNASAPAASPSSTSTKAGGTPAGA